jgi:hypothetical protein
MGQGDPGGEHQGGVIATGAPDMPRKLRISGHRESLYSSGGLRIDRVARLDGAKMRWGIFLVAASIAASGGAANAQSVANTIAEFGLVGTWASDCSKPASSSNYLTVYATKPSGEVSRTYYDAPGHVLNNYKIVSASRQAPDMLLYRQVWDNEGKPAIMAGDRIDVVLNMADNKIQIVSSQGSDGSYFVKDRKFPSDGSESPWQFRCPVK